MAKIKGLLLKPWIRFKKLSLKKKIAVIVILFAVTLVVIQKIQGSKKDGYILEKAKISSITETVSETGNIATTGRTDVYSPATGTIIEMYVQNGTRVVKGQELFKVASNATVQQQQDAYADYLTAKTSLDADRAELYSLQSTMYSKWKIYKDIATSSTYENSDGSAKEESRVLPEFTTAQDNWLKGEADYKNQQGVIAKDQADVNSKWLLYQATQNASVQAGSDGVISNLSSGIGDSVLANTSGLPSVTIPIFPVLSIADFSKYTLKVSVNESNIAKIRPGQKVVVEPDAFKEIKYKGEVSRVDDIGTNDGGVIKYNVYIEIENPDDKLKFGMTADAKITTKEVKNVLSVPNSAVKPYQGGKAVRVVGAKGDPEFIKVKTGVKGEKETEIISGISEGQEVITSLKNEMVKRKGMFGF